jgi:glycosyltransferase involved in cell wall biosynthesis
MASRDCVPFHANSALSNSLNPIRGLRAAREVAALAAALRPDVIHCHSSAAGFWTRLAIRRSVPTVFTAHGWGFMPGAPRSRRIGLLLAERVVSRYTSCYICVSERDGELARERGIAAPGRLVVIHNGVESDDSGALGRNVRGTIRLVMVGRLARPKEPEMLLEALSQLPAEHRDAYEVQIVGEGPLLPALREAAASSPVRVSLTGAIARDAVLATMAKSHVFALMSRYEGFPISILEAMSMGLAVVASDVGGVREAITPECGILIRRGDKDGLKHALARLAVDRGAIERFGAAARERARKEFSVTRMCDKTLAVYESVCTR